jgi:hypothetical protein
MGNKYRRGGDENILKGLAAGLIGGLIASWTMNRFQDLWIKLADHQRQREQTSNKAQSNNEEQDDTTVRAATAISEGLFNHTLTERKRRSLARRFTTAWVLAWEDFTAQWPKLCRKSRRARAYPLA